MKFKPHKHYNDTYLQMARTFFFYFYVSVDVQYESSSIFSDNSITIMSKYTVEKALFKIHFISFKLFFFFNTRRRKSLAYHHNHRNLRKLWLCRSFQSMWSQPNSMNVLFFQLSLNIKRENCNEKNQGISFRHFYIDSKFGKVVVFLNC